MSRILRGFEALADLLFGPDAKAPVIKNGAAAEAGRREVQTMETIAQQRRERQSISAVQPTVDLSAREQAERWLDRMIERGKLGVFSEVITMTPELAQALLSRNESNRFLSRKAVDKYVADIASGAWPLNGQTIVIAKDGSMNDGQHRCTACVEAKIGVPVIIVFGVSRETRYTLDQGVARQHRDVLRMMGVEQPGLTSTVAGYVWQFEKYGRLSEMTYERPGRKEIKETADLYGPEILAAIEATPRRGTKFLGGRPFLAFFRLLLARRASAEAADIFLDKLVYLTACGKGHPIWILHQRLTENAGRMKLHERAEVVVRCWNAWRLNERPTHFKILGGAFPHIER